MSDRKYDLEDRLVNYSCRMIDVVEALPNTRAGSYIAGQLIKSCISPTFKLWWGSGCGVKEGLCSQIGSGSERIKGMPISIEDYLKERID